jgi:environmental stress-induced protein Ves
VTIITPSAFRTMSWKNGGGITHEILKEEAKGIFLWRLSIAEVKSDGPFSLFPGLSRILTVIEGDGLELATEDRLLQALPLSPLAFSGDWPITSRRMGGHVKDFNVIFDAAQFAADVVALRRDSAEVIAPLPNGIQALLCLSQATANGLDIEPGSLVVAQEDKIAVVLKAPALRVSIHPLEE